MKNNNDILKYALAFLEKEHESIQEKINYIKAELGDKPDGGGKAVTTMPASRPRRLLSVSARKRISAAQKKRWSEFHKAKRAA